MFWAAAFTFFEIVNFTNEMWWSEQLPFLNAIAHLPDGHVMIWAAAFPQGHCSLLNGKYEDLISCLSLRALLTYLKEMRRSEHLPFLKAIAIFCKGIVMISAAAFP